jgi:hypothetical protein
MRINNRFLSVVAFGFAVAALACSNDGTGNAPGSSDSNLTGPGSPAGGGSDSSVANGTLTVHLTDSPFSDATALLITFSEVSVHSANPGAWTTLPFAGGSTRTCDLKQLNGPTDVLGVGSLPVGKYTQIRLTVTSATIYFGGAASGGPCSSSITPPAGLKATVDIPSGEVKLNHEFTVASGGTSILLDFDGEQSVRQTGSGNGNGRGNSNDNTKYMMSPVIRVVSVQ